MDNLHEDRGESGRQKSSVMSFQQDVSDYLKNITEKPARLFGIRYYEYLQAKHYSTGVGPRPQPMSPSQRLVQLEIRRIFTQHYGVPAERIEKRHS
jgi:hypothetical protein